MGSGIRNVSDPDGGSSLVNLRVALRTSGCVSFWWILTYKIVGSEPVT